MIDKSREIVKCDFCEKEDRLLGNVKLGTYTFPEGWITIEVSSKLTRLDCCPVCTRLLVMASFITSKTSSAIYKPDELKEFFPNLKDKD
jgi:hypothetical protein